MPLKKQSAVYVLMNGVGRGQQVFAHLQTLASMQYSQGISGIQTRASKYLQE